MQLNLKRRSVQYGNLIKCKYCDRSFGIYGPVVNTDIERLRATYHYDLWKLGVRVHQINYTNYNFINNLKDDYFP